MTRLRLLAVRLLAGVLVVGLAGFLALTFGRLLLALGLTPTAVVSIGAVSAGLGFLVGASSRVWNPRLWAADLRASEEHPESPRILVLIWTIGFFLAVSIFLASLVPAGQETYLFVLASAIAGFGLGVVLFVTPPRPLCRGEMAAESFEADKLVPGAICPAMSPQFASLLRARLNHPDCRGGSIT